MTDVEALAGVYPHTAPVRDRLSWNRERERALLELPACPDVELSLRLTRKRIAMLEDLIDGRPA